MKKENVFEYVKSQLSELAKPITKEEIEDFKVKFDYIQNLPKQTGTKLMMTAQEMALLTSYANGRREKGSIGIVPAYLKKNRDYEKVYLIFLGGTEFIFNQSTNLATDLLAALELNNAYYQNAKKIIFKEIPGYANIIIYGISLGGMIAQQLASDKDIKNNYNIYNIVTFGSPPIKTHEKEGMTIRLCDKTDIVPYLSIGEKCSCEQIVEDGGYSSFIVAHCFSYLLNPVWLKYDTLGFKNGNNIVILNFDEIEFFENPIIDV